MITQKFKSLFKYLPKSNLNANQGRNEGSFTFYTSSSKVSKRTDKPQFFKEAIIFGNGGSANIHYSNEPFGTTSHCIVATQKEENINIKYVYYYLSGNLHLIERGFKGVGLKNISPKYIENLDIPIFPIETQNKIVSVLDKANSLIKRREDCIKMLDELVRAMFLEMFQNDLINFKKSKVTLSDIVSITSGLTKGRKTKENFFVEVPYLRVANAQDGYFDLKEIKYINATTKEISNYNIIKGDLLITEGGDPDKLGRGSVWELEDNKFIYQNHLYRLRINNADKYSPYWLMYLIRSEFGKYYFLRQAKQTTGIATVNKKQVSQFPIPKSSFDKQKEFENYFLKIKDVKSLHLKSNVILKELFNSIIQKVFNGQLNFNIDFELDALIDKIDLQKKDNDIKEIAEDIAYLQRLIDKLNTQDFSEKVSYDKAKIIAFQLMNESLDKRRVIQMYDEKTKSIKLSLV